jgi:hypothetical protein
MNAIPYLAGAALVLVVFVVVWTAGKFQDPLKLIRGEDNRLSTSQFQFWLWTLVVFFAYATIYTARALKGVPDPISYIPGNVMLVMGFSASTYAAARAITGAFVDTGRIPKTLAPTSGRGSLGGIDQLLTRDDGSVDLQKVQILTWTVIAVAIYVTLVVGTVGHIQQVVGTSALMNEIQTKGYLVGLPNIDSALMVLMGLSQAAYLGGKLTSTSQPRITAVSTSRLALGQQFTILGASLGNDKDAGVVTLSGVTIPVSAGRWTPTKIDLRMPDAWQEAPSDTSPGGRFVTADLRVVAAGQTSDPWPIQFDLTLIGGAAAMSAAPAAATPQRAASTTAASLGHSTPSVGSSC